MTRKYLNIILVLLIATSTFSVSPAFAKDDFPSNKNLTDRNVALKMSGYGFTSGMRRNQQGNPDCNGIAIYTKGWSGSGFIVNQDGTVVTNYHVARRAYSGEAQFDDGGIYKIQHIKVYDPKNDIAILKVRSSRDFPTVLLGNSDTVEPRDPVLAIGNPQARGINMTEGKISQVVKNDQDIPVLLTHTATITSGNSGGALYRGKEVIGVNVSVFLNRGLGGQDGFYNAVPINLVKRIMTPENERRLLLNSVFGVYNEGGTIKLNIDTVAAKLGQGNSYTGTIPAATSQGAKYISYNQNLPGLADVLLTVNSPGNDLGIKVFNANNELMGCGDLRIKDNEFLIFSSEYRQTVSVVIFNYSGNSVNYAYTVNEIVW